MVENHKRRQGRECEVRPEERLLVRGPGERGRPEKVKGLIIAPLIRMRLLCPGDAVRRSCLEDRQEVTPCAGWGPVNVYGASIRV